jgi:PAS domain S-box-containing protein
MLPYEASFDCSMYKEVFETTSDLVLITDHQGMITRTNRKAARIFPDESTLGSPFWTKLRLECSNLDEALDILSPKEPEPGTAQTNYCCEATRSVYDINLVPLGDDDTGHKGFLLILNDITCLVMHRADLERQVKERSLALARSQKMLQTVFQGVGKGIILIDEDREVIESNQKACEIFGLHPENILGVHICSLCDGSGQETVMKMMDNIIENQILSSELTALYFDKSSFPAVFTVSVITVEGNRLWIIIAEDISEQKGMEQQLKNEKVLTEEVNITLRNVLKNIQGEQQGLADKLSHKIANDLLPVLNKIRSAASDDVRNGYIDFLGELLASLTKGSDTEIDFALHRLSKTEMKICKFILAGFSSKEICATMNLAFDTIQTHRKNIRKKLGLAGSANISLHGYLINRKMSSLA